LRAIPRGSGEAISLFDSSRLAHKRHGGVSGHEHASKATCYNNDAFREAAARKNDYAWFVPQSHGMASG